MKDCEHLIFGDSKLTQVRSAGQDEVVSPVDSGIMLFQNVKVGAVRSGGESWYTRRCYPWGRKAGNARAGGQGIGHELPNQV